MTHVQFISPFLFVADIEVEWNSIGGLVLAFCSLEHVFEVIRQREIN